MPWQAHAPQLLPIVCMMTQNGLSIKTPASELYKYVFMKRWPVQFPPAANY